MFVNESESTWFFDAATSICVDEGVVWAAGDIRSRGFDLATWQLVSKNGQKLAECDSGANIDDLRSIVSF
jgi:hypothetical protein